MSFFFIKTSFYFQKIIEKQLTTYTNYFTTNNFTIHKVRSYRGNKNTLFIVV